MKEKIIVVDDISYRRYVEKIGDVEKISWYYNKTDAYSEILDQNELDKLETEYEKQILFTILPIEPIL